MRIILHISCTSLCVVLLLVGPGCEADVAGPSGVDEPYSVFGIINPRLTQQTLLVSAVEDLLYPLDSALDAVVTSTNLTTGETHTWADSVTANDTGQLDHIFWADFRPDFGSRHRIEVARSDGASSRVDVQVPHQITLEQEDTGTRDYYVEILGEDVSLIRLEVTYGVRGYWVGMEEDKRFPFVLPYSEYTLSKKAEDERSERGWRVRLNLELDYEMLRSNYFLDHTIEFRNPICEGLGLFSLEVSMTIGSGDWAFPGGEADPNALSHPSALRNVENGFGFVGGGYNEDRALHPSTATLDDTFFFDFIDGRVPDPGDLCLQQGVPPPDG